MKKITLFLVCAFAVCLNVCAQKNSTIMNGKKVLVAYFSATGTTASVAKQIATVTGGTVHNIKPQKAYTAADLDWHNKRSRSSVEIQDANARPALAGKVSNMASYDVVFIGYPIWWNIAPNIINTFIESHNLKGKILIPFATSGGSTLDNSEKELKKKYPNLNWKSGKLLNHTNATEIKSWLQHIK